MTGSRPTRRPRDDSRRGAPDPGALARLTAARDHLDADLAAARLREDELLAQYATIETDTAAVVDRRDTALAELDRKAQAVRAEADDALAAVEARRGEVLVRLSQRRSAEELHALVGLPLRRVRRVLQTHRPPADADAHAAAAQPRTRHSPGPAAAVPVAVVAEPAALPRSTPDEARPPVSVLLAGEHGVPSSPATANGPDPAPAEHH